VAEADALGGGGEFAGQVERHGVLDQVLPGENDRLDAVSLQSNRRSLANAATEHGVATFEDFDEAGMVPTSVFSPCPDRSGLDHAVFDFQNVERGAAGQVIANENPIRGPDSELS
jgi:hypothetical protein